jgi:hypothetical protein
MSTITSYTYSISTQITAQKLNSSRLHQEITNSEIAVSLSGVNSVAGSDNFDLVFKDVLSSSDESILTALVLAHSGEELLPPVQEVTITEQPPFAKPDYRTKRDAISDWQTIIPSENKVIDFLLAEERYVTGGEIIFKNAKEGDYISAEVYDVSGLIPDIPYGNTGLSYRQALCEDWPVVAKYIVKKWIIPTEVDKYGSFTIDTYPLNAKISQGLCLRVTYHASAETGDRKCVVNYYLTQKLI